MARLDHEMYALKIEDARTRVAETDALAHALITGMGTAAAKEDPAVMESLVADYGKAARTLATEKEILKEIEEIAQSKGGDTAANDTLYNEQNAAVQAARASAEKQNDIEAGREADEITPAQVMENHKKSFDECIARQADAGGAPDRSKCEAEATAKQEQADEKYLVPKPEYKEQCYLLAHIFDLVDYKIKKDKGLITPGSRTDPTAKRMPYSPVSPQPNANASLIVDGDPYKFMNLLTQYPTHKRLHNLSVAEISQLQPMIRLYKVTEIPNAPYEKMHEMRFDSNLLEKDMTGDLLLNKQCRGVGVGIKDFTFAYEADNPFAIKKSITAKLTLFANSFDELLRDRRASTFEDSWTYVDLALKTGSPLLKNYIENQNMGGDVAYGVDKLNFRLKAVVGWASPGSTANTVFKSDEYGSVTQKREAIYNSYVSLNLTPTVHEFDIDDMGRVTFTINYLAYIEEFFDQPGFNIFTDDATVQNVLTRKLQYQTLVQNCENSDKLAEKKESWQPQIEEDRKNTLKALLLKMNGEADTKEDPDAHAESTKIYILEVDYKELADFMSLGPYFESTTGISDSISTEVDQSVMNSLLDSVDSAAADPDKKPDDEGTTSKSAPKTNVSVIDQGHLTFFYVSDLIDIIVGSIGSSLNNQAESWLPAITEVDPIVAAEEKKKLYRSAEQYKRLRVVLGPLEITNPKSPALSKFISLGDVPISVKYFIQWLTKKMLQRSEVVYTLSNFLNSFLNELVRDFLGNDDCFNGMLRQSVRLSQAAITSYKEGDRVDRISEAMLGGWRLNTKTIEDWPESEKPLLDIAGPKNDPRPVPTDPLAQEMNYLIYFAGRIMPAERATGDKVIDEEQGIHHYAIGRDRGIVKTINFRKTDAVGLKELRFEQQGYDGLQQLREQYDVEIETYSNVGAFPGVYIYVVPESIAPNVNLADLKIDSLTQLGIGGYHMIIRSEHSFAAGQANSTITAKWVAEKFSNANPPNMGGAPRPQKCQRGTG